MKKLLKILNHEALDIAFMIIFILMGCLALVAGAWKIATWPFAFALILSSVIRYKKIVKMYQSFTDDMMDHTHKQHNIIVELQKKFDQK